MKIDLSVKITKEKWQEILQNEKMTTFGHVGTHFDVMNRNFDLENTKRKGCIFDVRKINGREIAIGDIDLDRVNEKDFVIFHTGFLKEVGYGSKTYFKDHPQVSKELIKNLIDKKVSMIGIDAAGIRSGVEHKQIDQLCADHNIFVVENINQLEVLDTRKNINIYTFPLNIEGLDGLPCRVIAEIDESNEL